MLWVRSLLIKILTLRPDCRARPAAGPLLDLGIVDSIADKHREYPSQIVIEMCLGATNEC